MTTVISMRTSQEVGPKTPVSSASTVSDEDEESKRISGFSPKANKGAVAPPAATNGISAEKENAEDAMAVDKKDLSDLAKASGALATLQQPQGAPPPAAAAAASPGIGLVVRTRGNGDATPTGTPTTPTHHRKGSKDGTQKEGRKGTPWTEAEHVAFLDGLQVLGKGNWRGISKKFVPTRTPTQVASHAQKHFLRVTGATKRKSRFTALEQAFNNSYSANIYNIDQNKRKSSLDDTPNGQGSASGGQDAANKGLGGAAGAGTGPIGIQQAAQDLLQTAGVLGTSPQEATLAAAMGTAAFNPYALPNPFMLAPQFNCLPLEMMAMLQANQANQAAMMQNPLAYFQAMQMMSSLKSMQQGPGASAGSAADLTNSMMTRSASAPNLDQMNPLGGAASALVQDSSGSFTAGAKAPTFPPFSSSPGGSSGSLGSKPGSGVFKPVPSRPSASLAQNRFGSPQQAGGFLQQQSLNPSGGGMKNVNSTPSLPSMMNQGQFVGFQNPLQTAVLNSIKEAKPSKEENSN